MLRRKIKPLIISRRSRMVVLKRPVQRRRITVLPRRRLISRLRSPITQRRQIQTLPLKRQMMSRRTLGTKITQRSRRTQRVKVKEPPKSLPPPPQPPIPTPPPQNVGSMINSKDIARYYKPIIRPSFEPSDLFDKQLRRDILTNMRALNANSLQNEPPFPKRLGQGFVISIRPERLADFKKRFGPWARNVTHWPGVNGRQLDLSTFYRDGSLVPYQGQGQRAGETSLNRGEVGCYLAHYRLWEHIAKNNIAQAFIMEDDVAISYSKETHNTINRIFNELDRNKFQFDLFYIGNGSGGTGKQYPGTGFADPQTSQGTFAYCVTLAGAKKLVQCMMPMRDPVDEALIKMKEKVKQISLQPSLCLTVSVSSDTTNIK